MIRKLIVALVLMWVAACGEDSRRPGSDMAARCAVALECDDGVFCNGLEQCDPGSPAANAVGCVAGADPCGGGFCDETGRRCEGGCADADGDGQGDIACGGTDCDDTDPSTRSGGTEICDLSDNDCDGSIDEDCEGDQRPLIRGVWSLCRDTSRNPGEGCDGSGSYGLEYIFPETGPLIYDEGEACTAYDFIAAGDQLVFYDCDPETGWAIRVAEAFSVTEPYLTLSSSARTQYFVRKSTEPDTSACTEISDPLPSCRDHFEAARTSFATGGLPSLGVDYQQCRGNALDPVLACAEKRDYWLRLSTDGTLTSGVGDNCSAYEVREAGGTLVRRSCDEDGLEAYETYTVTPDGQHIRRSGSNTWWERSGAAPTCTTIEEWICTDS